MDSRLLNLKLLMIISPTKWLIFFMKFVIDVQISKRKPQPFTLPKVEVYNLPKEGCPD